jgi:SH3-like domain-containing protein
MRVAFFNPSLVLALILIGSWSRAEPVCIKTAKANLRTGPAAKFPVSWKVGQFMPLIRVNQKGTWSQVKDLDGETHWVATSCLTNRFSCLVIKAKSAKLMTGPSHSAPPAELGSVDRYTSFRKVERSGSWVLVQDEYEGQYWVNESSVWVPTMHSKIDF